MGPKNDGIRRISPLAIWKGSEGETKLCSVYRNGERKEGELQVRFQEWLQEKKQTYQRNLAEDEDHNELGEPETMPEQRTLDEERADTHWQESYLYRLLGGMS